MSLPVAVITGGEGDLGKAIRAEFEQHGWQVHAPGRKDLDVTSKRMVQAFFNGLTGLDLLVHNAGITRDAGVGKMSEAEFDEVLQVHLKGAFLCSQAALKIMVKQRGGHIIHIGSFSAHSGPIGQSNYAAAKAGLVALTQTLAVECGAQNLRANCVLPGFLATKMTRGLLSKPANRERVLAAHTLGRLNTPQDAARFIAFLHTMEHVSGQVFQLDSRIRRWA